MTGPIRPSSNIHHTERENDIYQHPTHDDIMAPETKNIGPQDDNPKPQADDDRPAVARQLQHPGASPTS